MTPLDAHALATRHEGLRRVDEAKVAGRVVEMGRADAGFVKQQTGFSIGGVAPLGHLQPPVVLIDRELVRFDTVWAAAGQPNGVFCLTPQDLVALTGAPMADVVADGVAAPVARPTVGAA